MNGQANIPEIVRKPYVISPLATKSKSEQRWNPATNDTPLTPSSSRSHVSYESSVYDNSYTFPFFNLLVYTEQAETK